MPYTQRIDKAILQGHMVQVYNTITREETQILVRLPTNHVGLNRYKWRVKLQDSARCECGAEEEMVQHFLLQCPQWAEQRIPLQQALGERGADLAYALGGWSGRMDRTRKYIDGEKGKWKPNTAVLKAVIKFVKATQRLE